jgi:hypothetical protein
VHGHGNKYEDIRQHVHLNPLILYVASPSVKGS